MKKNKNRNGFTLIELLAVIVILGLLMAIAIPNISKYITQSRKKTLTTTIQNYIGAVVNEVNNLHYSFSKTNTIYAIPIECVSLERGGLNPLGKWHQATDDYFAYVLVQYNDKTSSYKSGYTFKDSNGFGLYPTALDKIKTSGEQIEKQLSITKPKSGKVTNITSIENWNGFDVNSNTNLKVLISEKEGIDGDGKNTCKLAQKGENYATVEEEKAICYAFSDLGLNVGGEVNCGDEKFFIIENKENEIVMLSDKSQGNSWFSFRNYWTYSQADGYELREEYGSSYPVYVYKWFSESSTDIVDFVTNYEKHLKQLGITSARASVISHEQLINLGCELSNQGCKNSPYKSWLIRDFVWWTGSAAWSDNLWTVTNDGSMKPQYRINNADTRPIVTVSIDEIMY